MIIIGTNICGDETELILSQSLDDELVDLVAICLCELEFMGNVSQGILERLLAAGVDINHSVIADVLQTSSERRMEAR